VRQFETESGDGSGKCGEFVKKAVSGWPLGVAGSPERMDNADWRRKIDEIDETAGGDPEPARRRPAQENGRLSETGLPVYEPDRNVWCGPGPGSQPGTTSASTSDADL